MSARIAPPPELPPATPLERRCETRWPVSENGILTILTERRVLPAGIVDVSERGLRVRLLEPLAIGDRVRVEFRNLDSFGEVRWCQRLNDDHYHAGIMVRIALRT